MRIGITGDTHGDQQALRRVVKQAPPVEQWFHTGDYAQDGLQLKQLTGLSVTGVLGNCDGMSQEANVDEILVLEGKRVWLTHGHRYMGHTHVEELVWWAKKLEVDIVIYGHTHVPMNTYYGDILLINPGSPSRPRGGSQPSFAVLTLKEGQPPQVEHIELESPKPTYFSAFGPVE